MMTLYDQLPVLVVVLPLFLAPLVATLPSRGKLPWLVATITTALTFAISISLVTQVLETGSLTYLLGNWPIPFGIGLYIGPFSAMMALIISGASLAGLIVSASAMDNEVPAEHQSLLYSCWLLAMSGLIGIVITGDAFNVFVFMEISSLASYVMVANGPTRQGLTASFKYLVTGTMGATFYLIGVGYLYMMTGTLNMADMAVRLEDVSDTLPVIVAGGFLILGLAMKAALFPMHAWMPNAYQFAPSAVAVFFAACSTKVALYVMLRFQFQILTPNLGNHLELLNALIMTLSVIGFIAGSLIAIFSDNLKRLLGYSSVAQLGYIVLAISLGTSAGISAAIIHTFNHAIMKAALFAAVAAMVLRFGSSKIEDLAGVGKQMPLTMLGFALAGLSLIGVPLTAGFISKWYLIQAVLESGTLGILLTLLILTSSLMAVIYIWKVIEIAYFQPARQELPPGRREAPAPVLIVLWALVLANFWFGIDPELVLSLARSEAVNLMGVGK
ncbi:monovalent cation/H+ antiporter subunit D family protein [Orrella marina]|uniref:Cation:proton antiporter n=1 Tax=Orrella marina TaxID=2163011 RepID=A0A2R4XLD5_9BURK|nr:monovalent cation/H+ antiporter subunit D family protein [Orrella marina]AWB34616.1 cation:proton antiporter [Orrella marina]